MSICMAATRRTVYVSPTALERTADGKPETAPFAGKGNTGQGGRDADLGIRIIKIDKSERNIDDRDLNTELDADACLIIL